MCCLPKEKAEKAKLAFGKLSNAAKLRCITARGPLPLSDAVPR